MKDTINDKELLRYLFGYAQRLSECHKALYQELVDFETFVKTLVLLVCRDDAAAQQSSDLPSIEQLASGHGPASISCASNRGQIPECANVANDVQKEENKKGEKQ